MNIGRLELLAMASASGVAVANIYYNQPMLGIIEAEFGYQATTSLIPAATQVGYALGLFFILPLGDLLHRRRLIVAQFTALAMALVLAAMSPSPWMLVIASLIVGASSTVAQQIVPFAAALAVPEKRGATIGTVMAGLLSGILFSRTLSGFIGEHYGWREMFWIGAPMALIAAGATFIALPDHRPALRMRYFCAIRSLAQLWVREQPLRVATFVQAALFASFSAFWTILALYLQTPRFNLGADVAGLFGIVGAVGVFAAPLAGRIADRRGPHSVVWVGALLTLAAWVLMGVWGTIGALIVGVIILDFGVQSALVSNQHVIYELDHEARSRVNTIFMTGMFLGGATGSGVAMLGWSFGGWPTVSVLGGLLATAALGIAILAGLRRQVRLTATGRSGHRDDL